MRGDAELGENAYSDIIGIGIVAELKNASSSSTCDVVVALFLLSRLSNRFVSLSNICRFFNSFARFFNSFPLMP
jgi:hypothetical protein